MKAQQQRKANKNEVLKRIESKKNPPLCGEAEGKKKTNKKPYDITE